MLILSQRKITKNRFFQHKKCIQVLLGSNKQWVYFSVTTQTRKTDEAEIAPDSYMFVHMMIQTQVLLSWRLKRIFPVLTCENFCTCQRNRISFIGLAKKFVHVWVFFFFFFGNPINASTSNYEMISPQVSL